MKHVKLLLLSCFMAQGSVALALDDAYCDGFLKGFSQRYCLLLGKTALDALPPVCPEPALGADSAQDGYNRGFLVGLDAAHLCDENVEGEPGERLRAPDIGFSAITDLQR